MDTAAYSQTEIVQSSIKIYSAQFFRLATVFQVFDFKDYIFCFSS